MGLSAIVHLAAIVPASLSRWFVSHEPRNLVINFNLVAMVLIIIIGKLSKIIAEEEADREVLDIGSGI